LGSNCIPLCGQFRFHRFGNFPRPHKPCNSQSRLLGPLPQTPESTANLRCYSIYRYKRVGEDQIVNTEVLAGKVEKTEVKIVILGLINCLFVVFVDVNSGFPGQILKKIHKSFKTV
jgi:hypothetical protein